MIAGLGERLAELREARKLSQKKMADALGISQTAVAEYETSVKTPSAEVMLRLASFFSVSTDYLFGTEKRLKVDIEDLPQELRTLVLDQVATYKKLNGQK